MKRIPYATQWIDDDDVDAVSKALHSAFLTQGPKVREFEDKVASYCKATYAVALNSGTSALHAACFAAGINEDSEVITSPITFVASANCVLYCKGKPIFADIDQDTINIDPQEIEKKITPKTKAIIPVHFTGQPCDMKEIQAIAKKHRLLIIEDAAHALGSEYADEKIGACTYSDMTCLSFHAVKHITTGEGGMVLTNNKLLYEKLVAFRTHGITRDKAILTRPEEGDWYYEMQELGFNYRITDFQSALGICQLGKLDKFVKRRQEIVARYDHAFQGLTGVKTIIVCPERKSAWHLYPIVVSAKRKEVFNGLRKKGVGVNVHYLPVYLQPYYRQLGYQSGLCPNAERYYAGAITLPLYPKLSDQEVEIVIDSVKASLKEAGLL